MASEKSAGIGLILQALGRGISTGRDVGLRRQEQQRRAILATQREDIRQRERGEDIDFREKAVRRAIEDKINEKQLQAGRENAAELQRQLETEATEEMAIAKSERDFSSKSRLLQEARDFEMEHKVGLFKPTPEKGTPSPSESKSALAVQDDNQKLAQSMAASMFPAKHKFSEEDAVTFMANYQTILKALETGKMPDINSLSVEYFKANNVVELTDEVWDKFIADMKKADKSTFGISRDKIENMLKK